MAGGFAQSCCYVITLCGVPRFWYPHPILYGRCGPLGRSGVGETSAPNSAEGCTPGGRLLQLPAIDPRKGTVSDMQSKSLLADVRSRGLPRELASTEAQSLHRPSTRRC